MNKALKGKWYYVVLLACLFSLRFVYLDQDAPAYQLTNISQEDEPYYSASAILKLCKDEGRTVKGFEKTKAEGLDMYNRLLTYASLKIFGNNYWGLRIPDVVASILFLLLMFSIFNTINPWNRFAWLLIGFLIANFYLFTFSRYNNPQIFSVLAVTWVIWLIVKYGIEKPGALIVVGFFATFSVFFVYVMNFFLLAGVGLFVMVNAIRKKKILWLVYFIAGMLLCFLLLVTCLNLIGTSLSVLINKVVGYGGGDNDILLAGGSVKALFQRGITAITNTGFFRYQLPLLLSALVAIPLLTIKMLKRNEKNRDIALLILIVLACQCFQNFFAISSPFKKMLVDFPVIMILLFLVFSDFDLKNIPRNQTSKILMLGWVIVALLFCWFNYKTNKSPNYWNYTGIGCFGTTPLWFDVLNVCTCIGLAIFFFYVLLFSKMSGYSSFGVTSLLVVSLIANVTLTLSVFVVNRKYEVRDCLISLRPIIGNKVVIEGFPLSYQLYSNCKPALNGYDIDFINKPNNMVFNEMLLRKQADYVIDKIMQGSPLYHSGYKGLTLVKVFNFECYSYYLYKNTLE